MLLETLGTVNSHCNKIAFFSKSGFMRSFCSSSAVSGEQTTTALYKLPLIKNSISSPTCFVITLVYCTRKRRGPMTRLKVFDQSVVKRFSDVRLRADLAAPSWKCQTSRSCFYELKTLGKVALMFVLGFRARDPPYNFKARHFGKPTARLHGVLLASGVFTDFACGAVFS